MKHRFRLLKAFALVPVLNALALFLLSVLDDNLMSTTPLDWLLVEGMLLLGSPYAIRFGRYPTMAEVLAWPTLVVGLDLLLYWLLFALVLDILARVAWHLVR